MSKTPTPHGMALPAQSDFQYLKSLIEINPWKAFVLIHATLEFQMRLALFVDDRGRRERKAGIASETWTLLLKERSFRKLVNICFITGIINKNLRDKLITLNTDRNQTIGHIDPDLKKRDISDEKIAKICYRGLELMRDLLEAIQSILFRRPAKWRTES